jgi:hypothetical protein
MTATSAGETVVGETVVGETVAGRNGCGGLLFCGATRYTITARRITAQRNLWRRRRAG